MSYCYDHRYATIFLESVLCVYVCHVQVIHHRLHMYPIWEGVWGVSPAPTYICIPGVPTVYLPEQQCYRRITTNSPVPVLCALLPGRVCTIRSTPFALAPEIGSHRTYLFPKCFGFSTSKERSRGN